MSERLVDISRYPQLQGLAWSFATGHLPERVCLGLYERYWRFVDVDALTEDELAFIGDLAERYGNGMLNVPAPGARSARNRA